MVVCVQEYKCHNADILLKEDCTVDDLIDVIEVRSLVLPQQLIHTFLCAAFWLFAGPTVLLTALCRIQGNRRYVKCLYVYNKIDVCSMEEVDEIAR